MIKNKIFAIFSVIALAIVPSSVAFASTYNGTTVAPAADGQTYTISAAAGDVVTLSNVGGAGQVAVTFKNNVNGSIVFTPRSSLPAGAPNAPTGTVNTYYSVTENGFTDADISSATWNFSVTKGFVNNLGLSASNVFLEHFSANSWQLLTTKQVSSNTTYYNLSATTPSFSPFAVVAVPGLTNTGFPYAVSAIAGLSVVAIIGASFFLTRNKHTS